MWRRGDHLLIESRAMRRLPPKFDTVTLCNGIVKNFLRPENLLWNCSINC
jgi:hypothetical protein